MTKRLTTSCGHHPPVPDECDFCVCGGCGAPLTPRGACEDDCDWSRVQLATDTRKPFIGDAPPPIDQRPICPGCHTPLKPWVMRESDPDDWTKSIGRRWRGYHRYGHFCTLRCATAFANKIIDQPAFASVIASAHESAARLGKKISFTR